MRPLSRFYAMNMAVVDLASGTAEVMPVPEDLLRSSMGGACTNLRLLEQHREGDPLILGVGPLTGTFAPASGLMVATFVSPKTKKPTHTAMLRSAGADLKFSGLSFVVLRGRSSTPQALFVSQGRARLVPAGNLRGLRVPAAWNALRRKVPSLTGSVLVTGCAADRQSLSSAVSVDLAGSWDKCGMGLWMGTRNLKAVVLSGTGGLPMSEDQMVHARALQARMDHNPPGIKKGCLALLRKIEPTIEIKALARMRIKDLACYHCPFPCIGFIQSDRKKGEGFFLFDHRGFLALTKRCGSLSPGLMRQCLELGLDPAAAATYLSGGETMEQGVEVLHHLASGEKDDQEQAQVHEEPFQSYDHLFGGGIPVFSMEREGKGSDGWAKRVAAAMILGVCPLFMLLFPNLDEKAWLRLLCDQEEDAISLQDQLPSMVDQVLRQARL